MKLATALLLILLFGLAVTGQDAPSSESERITLLLKSGEEIDGLVRGVSDDGLQLDIGDGIVLQVRWPLIRGDRHFALRRRAVDVTRADSLIRLADFCHANAMDAEEAFALTTALRLEPGNEGLRARLAALPPIDGEPLPETPPPPVTPEPQPGPEPTIPAGPRARVWVDMVAADEETLKWLKAELAKQEYREGTKLAHDVRLRVDQKLTLLRNPTFMGAELYAEYDGTLRYELFRAGETRRFADGRAEVKQLRRDNKVAAVSATRNDLLADAFPDIIRDLAR